MNGPRDEIAKTREYLTVRYGRAVMRPSEEIEIILDAIDALSPAARLAFNRMAFGTSPTNLSAVRRIIVYAYERAIAAEAEAEKAQRALASRSEPRDA